MKLIIAVPIILGTPAILVGAVAGPAALCVLLLLPVLMEFAQAYLVKVVPRL